MTTTEYRIEIRQPNGVWERYSSGPSAIYYDLHQAQKIMGEVYGDTDKRLASREVTDWAPVPTPLELAIRRLEDPTPAAFRDDVVVLVEVKAEDLRLLLDAVKEAQL